MPSRMSARSPAAMTRAPGPSRSRRLGSCIEAIRKLSTRLSRYFSPYNTSAPRAAAISSMRGLARIRSSGIAPAKGTFRSGSFFARNFSVSSKPSRLTRFTITPNRSQPCSSNSSLLRQAFS
jgi:hypothetical protein